MQLLSAYLLETPVLAEHGLTERFDAVCEQISAWLSAEKGVSDPQAASGEFESQTGDGSGTFRREHIDVRAGRLDELRLEEFTRGGQIFTTTLATMAHRGRMRVYCTLDVTNGETVVAPFFVDPRCPSILRTLLAQATDWELDGVPVSPPRPSRLVGDEGGRQLAAQIRDTDRSLPIVVVSDIEDEALWPRLAEEIAFDLAGLAHVVAIDDGASWALSDGIGKLHSCYRGAVRLYWPARTRGDGDGDIALESIVWTASALLSNDRDGRGMGRLRSTLRRTVMSAAAVSLNPPAAIREIRQASEHQSALTITQSAEPTPAVPSDVQERLERQIEELQRQLEKSEKLRRAAEYALQREQQRLASLAEPQAQTMPADPAPPGPDEIRFYKKTHSKATYDVLVPVNDCGHTKWQASNKADKAKKGLERLLGGSTWKSLQHCGECQGGGMWKVRW